MEKQEWILVNDRLPEVDESDEWRVESKESADVWCYGELFGMVVARYSYRAKRWVSNMIWSPKGIEITHWMPLPEPPKQTT